MKDVSIDDVFPQNNEDIHGAISPMTLSEQRIEIRWPKKRLRRIETGKVRKMVEQTFVGKENTSKSGITINVKYLCVTKIDELARKNLMTKLKNIFFKSIGVERKIGI